MMDYVILGEDPRFDCLDRLISFSKNRVLRQFSPLSQSAVYVFSFREPQESLTKRLALLAPHSLAVVGRATKEQKELCEKKKITLIPLLEREDYLRQNAAETAQGLLSELIAKTDTTLESLTVLVLGYGNCGKAIASLLWLVGCEVFVHARQRGLGEAEKDGFNLFYAHRDPSFFDAVVNTVPAEVFSDEFLDGLTEGTPIFQVASGLSGREIGDFVRRGLPFYPLPGLPGRYSPQREAEVIGGIIHEELQRKREP